MLKTLLVGLSLFLALLATKAAAYVHILPTFSIDNDPVCEIYEQAYLTQLDEGKVPSFETKQAGLNLDQLWSPNDIIYKPFEAPSNPIHFTTPIVHKDVTWLEWYPVIGFEYILSSQGIMGKGTSIGSIKPAPGKSFFMQLDSLKSTEYYLKIAIIEDDKLDAIIKKGQDKKGFIPIEEGEIVLAFYPPSYYNPLKNMFHFKGGFYIADNDGVYKLEDGETKTVCKIGNTSSFESPQIKALEYIANKSLMTKGVSRIPNYQGPDYDADHQVINGFKDAIEKPWLMMVDSYGMCTSNWEISYCAKARALELILNVQASKDPWSYREVQAIREHMAGAQYVLSQFYINQFKIDPLIAKGIAKQAVYNFVEKTVYLHYLIRSRGNEKVLAIDKYTLDDRTGALPKNWFNKTELMWAAHFNDYDAIQELLQKGNTINDVTSVSGKHAKLQRLNRSALTYAAENATLPVIQSLIAAGADLNIKDAKGNDLNYYLSKNNLINDSIERLALMPKANVKPSFNCKLASTKQEKAICSSEGLSVYDSQMSMLYKKVRKNVPSAEIKPLQRRWLKELKQTCSMPSTSLLTKCMKSQYRTRIQYLNNLLVAIKDN
jgi:uncharacterized protein YecT (DUF1311 family)